MRPIRLEMKGFGPFRDLAVVDFADVDLLALVGPTGAGKSTIIDAITFALFGSVVRYDDKSAVAPAVNQLSTEARVLLDFEVAGVAYRAIRVVRRTANGASTREARLERGDQILAGRATDMGPAVEGLLGLDLDRFTRTVVLPQGRFAAFLHDKPGDRQDLLRQLLDLSVYTRMGVAAREAARTARDQLDVLTSLAGQAAPTDDDIDAMRSDATALATVAQDMHRRLGAHRRATAATDDARREAHDLGVLALALAAVAIPEEVALLAAELTSAADALETAAEAQALAQDQLESAARLLESGPNAELCRGLLVQRADLATVTQVLAGHDAARASADAAASAAIDAGDAARARLDALTADVESARAALDTARSAMIEGPDARALTAIDDRRARLATMHDELSVTAAASATIEDEHRLAEGAHRDAERDLAALATAAEAARLAAGAAGLLVGLGAGDPCPVCRRSLDTIAHHDVDAELAEATARHRSAVGIERSSRVVLDDATRRLVEVRTEQRSVQAAIDQIADDLVGAPDGGEVAAGLASAERLAADALAAEEAERERTAAAARAREDPEVSDVFEHERAAVEHRNEAERTHAAAAAVREQLATSLAGAPREEELHADIATADSLVARRDETRDALADAAEIASTAAAAHRRAVDREHHARQALSTTRDRLVALGAPSVDGPLAAGWALLAGWAHGRAGELDRAHRERANVADAAEVELAIEARAISALAAPWPAVVDNGDGPTLDGLAAAIAVAATRAELAVENALARRTEAAAREAEIGRLRVVADVDGELGRLLDATGFERWLMAEAVEDLVARATDRLLELSRGQYSLIAHGSDFKVCDHRNADELRDAKTLSGGETFLASLALALGLAESIEELATDGAPGMGSLFLDEGFGTLDPETLDVVAGAIEELGASGRMVGVVTHIRELADRMPVRFEVTKGPTTSSVQRVTDS